MYHSGGGDNYKNIEHLAKSYPPRPNTNAADFRSQIDSSNSKAKKLAVQTGNSDENGQTRAIKSSQGARSPKKFTRPQSVGTGASRYSDSKPPKKEEEEDYEVVDINSMMQNEKDERFRYLLKYGNIKRLEKGNNIIYAELPQIPGTLVFYRKNVEREANVDKLFLDHKSLSHIPLLEGEESLKLLSFKHNQIEKIQNLVSLPNLIYLDLSSNNLVDLDGLQGVVTLRVLIIAKNKLTRVKNFEQLQKLEILDLHGNQISSIEGLRLLSNLRTLNLENNAVTRIDEISHLTKLNELNVSMNKIDNLEPLVKLKTLNKLYLAKNLISRTRHIKHLKPLTKLVELTLHGNQFSIDKNEYNKMVLDNCPSLETLDNIEVYKLREESTHQRPTSIKQEKSVSSGVIPSTNKSSEFQLVEGEYEEIYNDESINPSLDIKEKQQKTDRESSMDHSKTSFKVSEDKLKRKEPEATSKSKSQQKTIQKYKSASPGKKPEVQSAGVSKHRSGANQASNAKDLRAEKEEELSENNKSELEPEKVIDILREQFMKELHRVERLRRHGVTARKELYKDSLLEGGHAEIENNNILYLYGNAFEVMLSNQAFQTTVEEIHFEFVIFDLLVQTKYMNYLKQYKHLQKIVLKHNNIYSFLQIAKLEALPNLTSLALRDNQVCSSELLRDFVIYRFPDLVEYNDTFVEENQRIAAKNRFKEFDNVLIFPSEFYKDGYKGVNAQKVVDDYTDVLVANTLAEATELKSKTNVFEAIWTSYTNELIGTCLSELKMSKNQHR